MRDGTAIEFYILNRDVSRAVIDELEEQIEVESRCPSLLPTLTEISVSLAF